MTKLIDTQLKNILFDIETVSAYEKYEQLPERFKPLWANKSKYIAGEEVSPQDSFFEKAAIYAEFGKIIVIGVGFFYHDKKGTLCFKSKCIYGHDEKMILTEFSKLLQKNFNKNISRLCAHNGKEFDYPYLCRRFVINHLEIPKILQLADKKPWEVPHYDTLDMWKFGDKKAYTSLELLASVLDVSTSKDSLDGSKVNATYYLEKNIEKIAQYCAKDVVVTAQIFLRLTGNETLPIHNISIL
jgi:hypothetical protein